MLFILNSASTGVTLIFRRGGRLLNPILNPTFDSRIRASQEAELSRLPGLDVGNKTHLHFGVQVSVYLAQQLLQMPLAQRSPLGSISVEPRTLLHEAARVVRFTAACWLRGARPGLVYRDSGGS